MIRSSEHSATKTKTKTPKPSTPTRTTLEASTTKQNSKDHDSDNDTNSKRDNNNDDEDTATSNQSQIAIHYDQQQDLSSEQGDNSSSSNNNNNTTNRTPKRNPFCSRCRNHGKSIQVKGHKRHCEYRECKCEGCFDVECRQIISARQIKRRRDQKQDEECGRQIEISPPVLRREPNNDPAALIAKTLIGSSSGKHLHQQQQQQVIMDTNAQKFATQAGIHHHHHPHPHPHHQLLPHLTIHPAAAAAAASSASLVAASNLASSSAQISSHHHHQLHGASGSSGSSNTNNNGNNNSSNSSSNNNNNNNNKSLHLHGAHLNLANAQSPQRTLQGGVTSSTASSALGNALHLFQLPNSMFSPAAGSVGGPSSGHPSSTVNLPLAPASTSSPLPSFREQITLVEEIHNTFGPLAIYAWLKAEHFDFQKVRDLIESSLGSYNNLIDLKFKYRLSSDSGSSCSISSRGGININNISNNNLTSNNVNNNNHLHHLQPQRQTSTSLLDTVITEDVNNVNCNHSGISRNGFISDDSKYNNKSPLIDTQTLATTALNASLLSSTSSLSTTTTTTATTMPSTSTPSSIAKTISNYQNISSTTPALAPPPTATTLATTTTLSNHLPTYPMCRISSSFNNSNNFINSDNNNFSKSPALAHHHHHHNHTMSLASSLNSLPMPTPNGLLWPDLKLATNGIPSASMIPPHHLLPHFMHHPFIVHQIHNQNQQVSPLSSIANLSSSSESSSSTIL